jgi:hypothetical protein
VSGRCYSASFLDTREQTKGSLELIDATKRRYL